MVINKLTFRGSKSIRQEFGQAATCSLRVGKEQALRIKDAVNRQYYKWLYRGQMPSAATYMRLTDVISYQ
jgi:hypothetical protein